MHFFHNPHTCLSATAGPMPGLHELIWFYGFSFPRTLSKEAPTASNTAPITGSTMPLPASDWQSAPQVDTVSCLPNGQFTEVPSMSDCRTGHKWTPSASTGKSHRACLLLQVKDLRRRHRKVSPDMLSAWGNCWRFAKNPGPFSVSVSITNWWLISS